MKETWVTFFSTDSLPESQKVFLLEKKVGSTLFSTFFVALQRYHQNVTGHVNMTWYGFGPKFVWYWCWSWNLQQRWFLNNHGNWWCHHFGHLTGVYITGQKKILMTSANMKKNINIWHQLSRDSSRWKFQLHTTLATSDLYICSSFSHNFLFPNS